jgi:salicylate hydroxylase
VLRHLGLEDDVLRLGVQPGAYVFRLHDTGEVIQEFSLADAHRHQHGAPYVQLHRADLHDLLATAACKLKPDLIRLNRKATGFTETDRGVTLHLADGSSVAGDILIGADGLKSTIARQIVGEIPATYTGDAAWRITVPVERLPKPFLPQVMSLFLGPGGHAVCYYLRGGALLNFVGCVETELAAEESWTQKFPWDLLQKDYEGWHPAVQAIVDAVDKDQCYRWSMHNRPPVRNWSTRRATILGDAAHATLPYLAQGAAMAIEDGAVLARALKQAPSIAEGLDLYQRNRVDRTARIVEQSTQNRWLFHLPSQQAMRDEFSKRNQGEERNRWLYSYNPLTVELT